MKKWLISPFVFLFAPLVFSQSFCERSQNDIKNHLYHPSSRISFKNDGGMMGKGVCWWHNRLQRSSAYLIQFEPDRNPPSWPELYKIIHSLRSMDKVVVIPGYADFETFTRDYQDIVQTMLNEWQGFDGFFNLQWIRGISGRSYLQPDEMQKRMDNVFRHYKNSPVPIWVMAQIKGITSHALLVLDMEKTANGYDLVVIDSNHPLETLKIEYYAGDTSLKAPSDKYTFVPYVGFQKDFRKLTEALRLSCGSKSKLLNVLKIENGEIEL